MIMKNLGKIIGLLLITSIFSFVACDNVGEDDPFLKPGEGVVIKDAIYNETFEETLGGFKNYSVSGVDTFAIDYGAAQVSGYVDNVNRENDLWLISPTINLANVDSAYVYFEYIFRYGASLNDISFNVTEDLTSNDPEVWTSLEFDLVSASDWNTWTKPEIDLTAYSGKKIRLAFHYISTTVKAGTWKIKNFAIYKGSIPPMVPEDNPAFDVEEVSIAQIRSMYQGATVKIAGEGKIVGVVISDNVGGNSSSLRNMVIASEDNSTGIMIRCTGNASYTLGDKVEILVKDQSLEQYNGAMQLNNVPLTNIRVIAKNVNIESKKMTVAELVTNIDASESTLVTVNGTITNPNGTTYGSSSKHTTLKITDGASSISSFVASYSSFVNEQIPEGTHEITGIAGINGGPQLNIRNLKDVK